MLFFYKIRRGLAPKYLTQYTHNYQLERYNTRTSNRNLVELYRTRTNSYTKSYFPYSTREWNRLSSDINSLKWSQEPLLKD